MLDLLLELVFNALSEIGLDLGWSSLRQAVAPEREGHPLFQYLGIVLLGAIVGVVSALLAPLRVLPKWGFSGLSLLISPWCSGLVMHVYGRWQRARNHDASRLATFFGGALFALVAAACRLLMLR